MADDARVAFDEFYARYHRRLRGFVAVLGVRDAEDVAQEAMVRAYASYAGLDQSRDPWPWLVAIARNVARDRWARPAPVPVEDVPVSVGDTTAEVDERDLVRAALGRLSSADRDVLVLREYHELTIDELSRLLGRSANAVRQQVFRARRRLAAAYTELGGRALGIATWLGQRWRDAAAAPVAAAAALVVGLPAMPPAEPPRVVTAGPVARGGATTEPAAMRAAPARPLQPVRAARLVTPRAGVRDGARDAARAPRERAPVPRSRGASASVGTTQAGHQAETTEHDAFVCALTALC
jgi:RNA polymerase sigma-70 factor (ECF subfamily)